MASAFSGIFSSSFSSCLDLERVMPAGGAGGGSSRWGRRGVELSPACLQPCIRARPNPGRAAFSTHLSLHIQSGFRNTTDERLGDVGVTLGPLAMVMPQQGAQGAGRDISGEGEFLLVTRVAGGVEGSE